MDGNLNAGGNALLSGTTLVSQNGNIRAGAALNGSFTAALSLGSGSIINGAAGLNLNAANIDVTDAKLHSAAAIGLVSSTGAITISGAKVILDAGTNISLNAANIVALSGLNLTSVGDLSIAGGAGAINLLDGNLNAGGNALLSGTTLGLQNGNVRAQGALNGRFTAALTLSGGSSINGATGLSLNAANIDVTDAKLRSAATIGLISSVDKITISGTKAIIDAGTSISLNASNSVILSDLRVTGFGDLSVAGGQGVVNVTNGSLSGGNILLSGTTLSLLNGNVRASGTLNGNFSAELMLSNRSILNAIGNITLNAAGLTVSNGQMLSAGAISVSTASTITVTSADAVIRSVGTALINAGTDIILADVRFDGGINLATLYGNSLTLKAGGSLAAVNTGAIILDEGQTLNGTRGVHLNATSIQLTSGAILSGGDLVLAATAGDISLSSAQAVVKSDASAALNATGALAITGTTLMAGANANINAGTLMLDGGGSIQAGGSINGTIQGSARVAGSDGAPGLAGSAASIKAAMAALLRAGSITLDGGTTISGGAGVGLSAPDVRLRGFVGAGGNTIQIATDRLSLTATAKLGGQGGVADVLFTPFTANRDIRVADGAVDAATQTGFDTRQISAALTNAGTLGFGLLDGSTGQASVGDMALSGAPVRLVVRGGRLSLDGRVDAGLSDVAFSASGDVMQLASAVVTARSVTLASLAGDVSLAGSVTASGGAAAGFTGSDLAFAEAAPGQGVRVSARQGRFQTLPGPGLPGGGQVLQTSASSGLQFASRGTDIAADIAGTVTNNSVEGIHRINGILAPAGVTPGSRYMLQPPSPPLAPPGPAKPTIDKLINQVAAVDKTGGVSPPPPVIVPPVVPPALPPLQPPGGIDSGINAAAKNFVDAAKNSPVSAFNNLAADSNLSFSQKSAVVEGFVQSNGAGAVVQSFAAAGGALGAVAGVVQGVAAGNNHLGDVRAAASGLGSDTTRLLEGLAIAARKERLTQGLGVAINSLLNDPALADQPQHKEAEPPNIIGVNVTWDASARHYVITGRLSGETRYPTLSLNGLWVWVEDDGLFTAPVLPQPGTNSLALRASAGGKGETTQMVTLPPAGAVVSGERQVELASLIDADGDLYLQLNIPDVPEIEVAAGGFTNEPPVTGTPGRRIALLIANNEYQSAAIPALKTPGNDANLLAGVLRDRFGYDAHIVTNATKAELINNLTALGRQIKEEDHLILYYAGHGYSFYQSNIAFWLPTDASTTSANEWISSTEISRLLHRMRARQVLLVSDSCYSGSLADKVDDSLVEKDLVLASQRRAVIAITSGGDEPVDDGVGNSPFALSLAETLRATTDSMIPANDLYSILRDKMTEVSPQTPGFGAVTFAGYDVGADFVFFLEPNKKVSPN